MKIEWVNHASFVLEVDNVRMICDPWLEGRVFNESWALLANSVFKYDDFKHITHIWFSHEHPDHFFPPNLKKIPIEYRERITVLFQSTKDLKVVEYCKNLEFKEVIELGEFEEYQVSKDMKVCIGKVKNDTDSWMHITTPERTILNLNDCMFGGKELESLGKRLGKVDVLLTQYSFASWVGNKNDDELIKQQAALKKVEIEKHVNTFHPKFTIPFASYVWFCNPDNYHFNTHANRIDEINQFLIKLGTKPIILYPGDVWKFEEKYDNSSAIDRYLTDVADLPNRELSNFESISFNELEKTANKFIETALSKNNKKKLRSYSPMIVYLNDLQRSYALSYKSGLTESIKSQEESDISFHSQNFQYCLKFEWGFDSILIAGTFEKPRGGNFQNFMEYEWIAKLNNQGKRMDGFIKRAFKRLFS